MARNEGSTRSGYSGDVSAGSEDSDYSSEESNTRIEVGFVVKVKGKKEKRPTVASYRRKRPLKEIAPSPIHPDIDISLTRHLTESDLIDKTHASRVSRDENMDHHSIPSDVLSGLLVDCFTAVRPIISNSSDRAPLPNNGHPMGQEKFDLNKNFNTSEMTPGKNNLRQTAERMVGAPHTKIESIETQHSSQSPQIIADNPAPMSITFSSHHCFLEDALTLTDIPRYVNLAGSDTVPQPSITVSNLFL